MYDVFGNPIVPVLSEFYVYNSDRTPSDEKDDEPPVKDDKENEVPKFGLATPLKVRNVRANPSRSALHDITPTTLTQRKHKAGKNSNTEVVPIPANVEKQALYDAEDHARKSRSRFQSAQKLSDVSTETTLLIVNAFYLKQRTHSNQSSSV